MKAVESCSHGTIFKIYCLEHKLSIIEKNLHKTELFSKHDSMISSINSFFNYKHDKFDLPLKPPAYGSTTRPWRSYLHSYKVYFFKHVLIIYFQVFIANYDRYCQISVSNPQFPQLPSKSDILILDSFEKNFCSNFDILEKSDSNLISGIIVYFNLISTARSNEFHSFNIEKIIVDQLFEFCFSKAACSFCVLMRVNLKSNTYK